MDCQAHPSLNLLDRRLQQLVFRWTDAGLFWCVWISIPGEAKTVSGDVARGKDRHLVSYFIAQVVERCYARGIYFVLEGADGSGHFRRKGTTRVLSFSGARSVTTTFCAFGKSYLRTTRLCGTLPYLDRLSRLCSCRVSHTSLTGRVLLPACDFESERWHWKPTLASRYPNDFCNAVYEVIKESAPPDSHSNGSRGSEKFWSECICNALKCEFFQFS